MDLPSVLVCMLLELLAGSCGFPQSRIVGGHSPIPHSIKYIVSIQSPRGQHFCGGSLINIYWVLTAAHCNIRVDTMWIVAGDYSLSKYEFSEQTFIPHRLIPHPQYNNITKNNDIMLIKLKAPVFLNRFVAIVPLPRQNTSIAEGRVCQVSGWGFTSSPGGKIHSSTGGKIPTSLHTVMVPIISTERCNSSESFNGNVTANMLCAGYNVGGKDACLGDSGGPLVCEGLVYGLVSWGEGCADAKYPGVYIAVSKYRKWIDDTIFSYYSRCKV